MRSYIERAQDFIKEIFPYIGEWNDPWNIGYDIDDFNKKCNRKVIMRHGIARIAFITSDYVVKYDFDKDEVEAVGGCENEVELYTKAVKDGFGYLFAEITHYHYNGHDFYIMPRIHGIGKNSWFYADAFMTPEENAWCERHHLTDLHYKNYGFRKNRICIVDYACRLEETSDYSEYSSSNSSES